MTESVTAASERPLSRRTLRSAAALAVVLLAAAALAFWVLSDESWRTRMLPAGDAASTALAAPFAPYAVPRPLPDITFQDGEGRPHSLGEFRGRVVLLNLWATWCVPCRTEMPTLDRLQARLGGKDFEVIALSIDREGAPIVQRFFDATKLRALKVYVDPTMAAQSKLAAVGIPTTVLIDTQGREVARKTGPAEWDKPDIIAVIERYLPSGRAARPKE